ncbi:hypothetical protein GQ600_24899 [Phytophthora cactorum]|nr:hypothetical protein GQ600_24899 [Phytophthora cactorum]
MEEEASQGLRCDRHNEGKQPVSRMATLEEDPSKMSLPPTPRCSNVLLRLSVEPTAMLLHCRRFALSPRLAHGDATFNKSYATYGRRGRGFTRPSRGARASRNGLGRRQTNTDVHPVM